MSEPPDDLETSPEVWLRYAGDDLTAGERALLAPPFACRGLLPRPAGG